MPGQSPHIEIVVEIIYKSYSVLESLQVYVVTDFLVDSRRRVLD